MIHGWDNYPIENFPRMWDWLAEEISSGAIAIPRVAYEEIAHVSPECHRWIGRIDEFKTLEVDNDVVAEALAINGVLGIDNDRYGAGVDANDVLIIATARSARRGMVTNEARQPALPVNLKNLKIPAVCSLEEVQVECIDFADLIRRSRRAF